MTGPKISERPRVLSGAPAPADPVTPAEPLSRDEAYDRAGKWNVSPATELSTDQKHGIAIAQLAQLLSPCFVPVANVDGYLLKNGNRDRATLREWIFDRSVRYALRYPALAPITQSRRYFFEEVEPRLGFFGCDVEAWVKILRSQGRWPLEDRS